MNTYATTDSRQILTAAIQGNRAESCLPIFAGSKLAVAFIKLSKNSRADILCAVEKVWGVGGVETSVIPDEPDVLDGGDVVEGVGVVGLASGCRVRRVVWWFLAVLRVRSSRLSHNG